MDTIVIGSACIIATAILVAAYLIESAIRSLKKD